MASTHPICCCSPCDATLIRGAVTPIGLTVEAEIPESIEGHTRMTLTSSGTPTSPTPITYPVHRVETGELFAVTLPGCLQAGFSYWRLKEAKLEWYACGRLGDRCEVDAESRIWSTTLAVSWPHLQERNGLERLCTECSPGDVYLVLEAEYEPWNQCQVPTIRVDVDVQWGTPFDCSEIQIQNCCGSTTSPAEEEAYRQLCTQYTDIANEVFNGPIDLVNVPTAVYQGNCWFEGIWNPPFCKGIKIGDHTCEYADGSLQTTGHWFNHYRVCCWLDIATMTVTNCQVSLWATTWIVRQRVLWNGQWYEGDFWTQWNTLSHELEHACEDCTWQPQGMSCPVCPCRWNQYAAVSLPTDNLTVTLLETAPECQAL